MGLLNYSTSIEVAQSVREITEILVSGGASAIMTDYDGARNMVALSFKVQTPKGDIYFKLPADPRPVSQIINEQTEKRVTRHGMYGRTTRRAVPSKFKNDMDQARRVAWRILKDWIEAQMALIEVGMVKIHQVFLPYAIMKDGRTVFEMTEDKGMLLTHEINPGGKS